MSEAPRQDYICKVRYQNDLPPPPCPPKLLKYTTFDPHRELSDSGLLSSLFRKENFKNLLPLNQVDLGMPMDLLQIPGLIERNDESLLLGSKTAFQLHPADHILLQDPQMISSSLKTQPVSFLRRTQYIAEKPTSVESMSSTTGHTQTTSLHHNRKRKIDEETDALAQVRAVEATFEKAQELEDADLTSITHPTRRTLKAKKVWNFLPDVSIIDKNFISLKFNGSASVTRSLKRDQSLPDFYKTSVFRPVNTEYGEEWVSFYTAPESISSSLKEKLDDTKENVPIDESSLLDELNEKYKFDHIRDYDMVFRRFESEKELLVEFDKDSKTLYFTQINGKIDLKRRRVTPALEKIVKENTIDRLQLSLREPTTLEAIKRDNARSRYDPINYIEHEEEEEEELEVPEQVEETKEEEKDQVSEDSKTDDD